MHTVRQTTSIVLLTPFCAASKSCARYYGTRFVNGNRFMCTFDFIQRFSLLCLQELLSTSTNSYRRSSAW